MVALNQARRITAPGVKGGLAVYGRNGQRCVRCGETVQCRRMGEHNRILYWCPGCQTHLDPKLERSSDDTPMERQPEVRQLVVLRVAEPKRKSIPGLAPTPTLMPPRRALQPAFPLP